jgi:hypothetical protein
MFIWPSKFRPLEVIFRGSTLNQVVYFCIIISYAFINYRRNKKNCICLNIISKILPWFMLYHLTGMVFPNVVCEMCGWPVGHVWRRIPHILLFLSWGLTPRPLFTNFLQTLLDASKEIGLEVNAEKTKYMSLSRHQNAGQNHDIKIGNRWFENVAQFRYLRTMTKNENLIQEDIKRRLNSGNACYHSVQKFCPLVAV